jgi:hypothetical protein
MSWLAQKTELVLWLADILNIQYEQVKSRSLRLAEEELLAG